MTFTRTLSRPFFLSTLVCIFGAICVQSAKSTSRPVYPREGAVPPIDETVQKWLSEIDLTGAPNIHLNHGVPPSCPAKIDPSVCYWTCQNCPADDVVTCPDANVWGLTFDDGPIADVTPKLLETLHKANVKATFFLIGGNVAQYPELVRAELEQGHHLASHTWSHHALTTLSNEQIVAEMKWTEKAIEDATGYRVKYMRPPYGDVDNRVRFVLRKLGYIVVDWTGDTFDSNDWKIPMKQTTKESVVAHMQKSIVAYSSNKSLSKKGFISLEHDLSAETIEVAQSIIPFATSHGLIIQSISNCLHDPAPYAAMNGVVPNRNNSLPTATIGTNSGNNNDGITNVSSTSSAGASRLSIGQHFLGKLFSPSSADIHSAHLSTKWMVTMEKAALWSLVLGSFVTTVSLV
ncbi:chitin deacetylase [Entomortierella beljakovae]|nr:chitin deacetylase [Entomortierella beljakovae]